MRARFPVWRRRRRGALDPRFRGYQIHTSHIAPGGSIGGGALRPIAHAPHPASPRKEAGRGDGEPQFCKNAPEMPSRRRPRSQVGPRPLSPPLCGEREGEGLGDWPHGFKYNRSRRARPEKLCAYDSRFRGDDKKRAASSTALPARVIARVSSPAACVRARRRV